MRETGYYWVNVKDLLDGTLMWMVLFWSNKKKCFPTIFNAKTLGIEEINETRILNPDEKNENSKNRS